MLKGNCNKCVHRDADPDDKVCVECGISRKNYEEETMGRTLKSRVLTAADIMMAHARLVHDIARDPCEVEDHAAYMAGQLVGAEKLTAILLDTLVEDEEDFE